MFEKNSEFRLPTFQINFIIIDLRFTYIIKHI